MLVKFSSKAHADITMFGEVAMKLLKMMGRSGKVPSAISAEDIPAALESLQKGVADADAHLEDQPPHEEEEGEERRVSLHNRALPLIEMLETAAREDVPVMWE